MKTLVAIPMGEIVELRARANSALYARSSKEGVPRTAVDYLTGIGWKLYPWQRWALVAAERWRNLMILAARQVGKTFLAASRARYQQVRMPMSNTPVVCPNQDKSKILIRRLAEVASKDPNHTIFEPDNTEEVGEAGSIVKGLPGTLGGVVGETAPLLMLDEAGLIGRQLYDAATPMQAHVEDPELWAMSSAWWKSGWFWEGWDTGPCKDKDGIGFVKILVRPPFDIVDHKIVSLANQKAFIVSQAARGVHAFFSSTPSREFLEQELATHTEMQIRQQYFCEFQSEEGAALDAETIRDMFVDYVKPMFDAPAEGETRPSYFDEEVRPL